MIADLPPAQISPLISHTQWEFYVDNAPLSSNKQPYFDFNGLDTLEFIGDEEVLTPLNLEKEFLPEYFQHNKQILTESFLKESKKYSSYIAGRESLANEVFNNLSNYIAELKYDSSYVELTDSNTLKLILSFPDNKIVMISQSLISDEPNEEVIYSFFINRELIASDVATLQYFTQNFKKYLSL